MYSNKGLSTPIVILIILVIISLVVGGISFWQYKTKGEVSLKPIQLFGGRRAQSYMNEAESEFSKLESIKDKDEESLSHLKKATDLAKKATELDSDNPELWYRQGNIYFKAMSFELEGQLQPVKSIAKSQAIKSYKKALELDPGNKLYQKKLKKAKKMEIKP